MTTATKICTWTGNSGKTYSYEIHKINTIWNDVAGNYIFAKETSPSKWAALYIGETQSLRDRLPNHEKRPCPTRNGTTHIHVHVNSGSAARLAEESDLIAANDPAFNR